MFTHYDITNIVLTIIAVILIPGVALLVRGTMKWTHTSDKIDNMANSMEQIVTNNDAAHQAIINQMTNDREATNRRLRWFEEYFMQNGMRVR